MVLQPSRWQGVGTGSVPKSFEGSVARGTQTLTCSSWNVHKRNLVDDIVMALVAKGTNLAGLQECENLDGDQLAHLGWEMRRFESLKVVVIWRGFSNHCTDIVGRRATQLLPCLGT